MSKRMPTVKELEAARKAADKVMLTSILANASKTAPKAAEGKTSAPSSAGLTVKPAATTTPVPPTVLPKVSSLGLLNPEIVNKYLQQGMAFAKQGPQSRMDIYNSLTGFDIGDYAKGDVNSLDYDISREMSKRNQYFMDQHRQQGTFDFPEFLVAGKITGPSTDYLTKQGAAALSALEDSKKKDEEAKAARDAQSVTDTWLQNQYQLLWSNRDKTDVLENLQNWTYFDWLSGDRTNPYDFGAIMDSTNNMSDDEYSAWVNNLHANYDNADWAALTNATARNYKSQTPELQAKYDLISGELTRRKRIEELENMADTSPNYAEWSVYQEPDVALDPMWKDGGAHALVAGLKAREERWGNKQNFINNWHQYKLTGGYEGVDNTLPGKIADFFQGITSFIGGDETLGEISTTIGSYIAAGLQYMSPDQVKRYNVLYKMGPEYAEEYLELIGPGLLAQKAAVEAEYYATRAQNLGTSIWDNVVGYVKKPWGSFNTMLGALSGETDPNAQIYGPARQVNVTREATGEALAEISPFDVFGVPVTKVGYNIFTSIGDMLVANKIGAFTGSLTGKADAAQKVMNFVMSSGAGTDTYLSDLQNGQDPMYAVFHGMAIGGIEAWSESGFIDSLFSPEGKFIARVAKSAGAEGLGGVVSEGGGMAVDLFMSFLTGQKNEIEKTYAYYDATMGKDKAALATLQHYANNFALAAVSEAMIGGGTSVVTNAAIDADTRSYGKDIVNNGDVDTIMNVGQSMPENSESKRVYDEITGKQEKGKKPSFYQFGQLTKAIVKDLGEERAAIVNRVQDEAIVERLVELGEDRAAAKQNASIIRRIARGEKVPRQEMFEAKWSDNASQVVKELTRETKNVESFAPGAVEDVGAREIGGKWVEGNTQEAEANRTGNKWVTDMQNQQRTETENVRGKQLQVQVATVTPIGKAANRAEEAAKKRVPKRDGKPKLATDSHVTFRGTDGNAEISGDIMRFEESDEGMQVVVQTGKGKEGEQKVKLEDWISADGDGVATILSYIGDDQLPHSVTAEEANTLMQVYKHSGGNAKAVIQAFDVNYLAGYSGNDQVGSVLDPALSKIAYENGKRDAEKDEARRFEMAKGRTRNENVSIGWIGEVDSDSQITGRGDPDALATAMESMTEEQRNAVDFISELCREFGANAVLYASKPGSNVSQSGRYDYDAHSDTFFFDINAGATTDLAYARQIKNGTLGAALPKFVGHEFTHFMQINSAEGYANYARAVKNALNERGQDVAVLMRDRIDQALADGRKLTMQEAEFEVIAHASEYMLQDSKFTDSMDDSLKGRFRQFIKEFGQKIRNAFAKLTGGTVESRALREQIDGVYHYVNDLQKLWDIGMTEAGNRPTQGTTTTSDDGEVSKEVTTYKSDAMDIAEDLETPDGKSLFSLRSMQEDYDTYRQMLADNGVSAEEIDALFETIDETMRIVESEREILDFGWNVGRDQRSFNPVKQNSDPLYKVSLDFSSLCRKRLLQQTVQERLEAKYDTVLTKAERVAIRNELMLLREEGKQIEVACALCYVESARLKSPAQIQRFFDDRRAVMVDYFAKKNKEYMQGVNAKADELIVKFGNKPGTKKGELNSFQKKAVENLKQSMYKTYTPSAEEEAIIRTALDLPGESFRSADGLWKLKKEHEEIFDAYTSFVRNATKSKGIEGDEAWWAGDSQNISDKLIAKMNAENGLRSQSWSDFQVIHLLDYMAAVIELSTRNAKMQTYTKVPDFVKLMSDTGAMINLSLIPKGFDGTLNYDPIEGMPIEDALALRRDFPDTAGTICIGITDKHIRLLLANDDIDYVIPYHASSLDKKTRQQMGMKVWEDFTNYQNEKQRDYSNTVKDTKTYHKKPSFSEWFDYDTVAARAMEVGANMAMQEAAERYIDLCHRRGLQEKFAQFANEPNYWKLLIDRKMINQVTGEIIQQKAVQPRFDLDRIKGILQGEVDRFKAQNQDFNEAVSHIEQKWENGDIRKAAKSKKVQDAVKAFEDTVIVRNIIESAAEIEQSKSLYAPREVDELTTRDYLAESDDSIAETVEERNALTIYQKLLKDHAAASEAVMAAEQALETAPESQKADARKTLSAARAKQRDLYNRLLNVERTAHVQSVINRTNQFMTEELQGKTRTAVEKAIADREAKIAELKADLTGLKGAAKAQREADIRQHERIVARFKSKAAQMVLENSEKYQRQIADIRLRRDLNIEIGKKTRHIKRVVKAMNDRIVHEEDYKNVKEPLKPAVHTLVRTFIDGFGNLVFDQKTADKLKSVYDVLAQDDATVEYYDDEVSDWLTTLAKLSRLDEERRAGGVTLESLNDKLYIYTTLADIADHVAHMVTAADTMFMEGRKASVSGVTEDIGNTLLAKEDRRELAGVLGKAANFVDNLIIRGNMMPQFFFEGLNNNGMMQLYDGLQDGVRMYSERLLTGENFLEDAMRRYGYHTWRDMDKVVEFKTQQGHTIHLKRENMMWIYATAKREASNPLMDTHHLDEGGFVYEESSAPTAGLFKAKGHQKHHKIVQEDVEAITAMLTAEQIAFMDECVEFLSTECAGWGNEASMQLFGIKKYKEKYYFPFKVDGGQLYKNSAAGSTSTTSDARVKHISFSHSIKKGANTPLVMGEFTSVIADHINQMATYSGMVVPIENMNRVLNRKVDDDGDMVTIRSLLSRKYGSPSSKYVDDLLKDLNGGPQTDNRGTWDAGIRLFKKNAVVGKMSVAIQQPTAITRAFAYINPRWFVNLHMERPKETWERMMKYSGTTVLKDMGGFNVGLGQGAKNWIERGDLGDYNVFKRSKFLLDQKGFKAAKDEWVDFLTGLPGWMDKVTWISIWNAAENEQAHQHPGMDRNSDEFLQMVGRRFDDIVNHTQVYDSILSKSQNMRSKNTLAKMATSFMAESTLNMNLAYRAFASRDVKQIGKVVSSLLLNAALGAAAYALVGSWNKDDDDRTWEEKYAVAFAGRLADNLNPMASIPYLSDIWNKIQGYDVERTDLSYVLDLAEDGMKFFDKMFNPDEALSYRDYENFVGGMFAAATGIPAKNWMGDARRIWNMTHTKNEDAPSSRVWYGILDEILPGRGTNNTAYYERLMAATMDGDKQEMYDLKDYLMATKGVKETSITSGVRDAYKKVYMRGGISKNDAVSFLLANGLATGKTEAERKQSAFEYVDKWEEGTEGYSAYNTLRKAFSDGNSASIQKAWDELEANGWSNDSIGTYVRNTIIKGMVTSGQISPSKATELIRKWYPYNKDKDNVDKPKEWLNSK